jgi:hypothetical protein
MRTWRWYSKLLFALLVAAFAYFVWPTPWRYHTLENGAFWAVAWRASASDWADLADKEGPLPSMSLLLRQHRVNGRTEMFIGGQAGWLETKPQTS